jgi:hypothetical protein
MLAFKYVRDKRLAKQGTPKPLSLFLTYINQVKNWWTEDLP